MAKQSTAKINIEADFYKRIYTFISQRISHREDAEEITQDVFLRLSKSHSELEEERVVAWVFKTARNAIIDFYRKSGRQPKTKHLPEDLTKDENPKSALDQMANCLLPFIEKLSSEEQKIINEVDLNEKTQQHYATENGLPYSTVKTKIQRTRKKLKKHLLGCCEMVLNSKGVPLEFEKDDCC